MSLMDFISSVQKDIIFDERFYGYPAIYSRRIEAGDGTLRELKTAQFNVSPQGNFQDTDDFSESIGSRKQEFWARTDDLKFDGVSFLPQLNDTIELTIDEKAMRFYVCSPDGTNTATFAYEDGAQQIIKFMATRSK